MKVLLQYKKLIFSCTLHSLLWVGVMVVIRNQIMFDFSGKDNLWLIFFSIVGVIYAITIAFLLIVVLEKYNKFDVSINNEINLIQDIRDFLIFIKVQQKLQKKLYENLLLYVKNAVNYEWDKLIECRQKNLPYDSDTCPHIYEVIKCAAQIEPKTQPGKIGLQQIISKIGDLTTIRTTRIELSEKSLSPLLYFYLKYMGAMLIFPFMLFNGGNVYMQGAMIFAVVSAVRILYVIVEDFDNPLTGYWNVDTKILKDFIDKEHNKDLNVMFFDESLKK